MIAGENENKDTTHEALKREQTGDLKDFIDLAPKAMAQLTKQFIGNPGIEHRERIQKAIKSILGLLSYDTEHVVNKPETKKPETL